VGAMLRAALVVREQRAPQRSGPVLAPARTVAPRAAAARTGTAFAQR